MTGPANAVMGDQDQPINLPETQIPQEYLTDEKKMATYSQTAEFKRLKEFMEARIQFYQRYFPNGQKVAELPAEERGAYWQAACVIIQEFENILAEYAQAREVVKDVGRES